MIILPISSATIRNGFDKLTYHTQKAEYYTHATTPKILYEFPVPPPPPASSPTRAPLCVTYSIHTLSIVRNLTLLKILQTGGFHTHAYIDPRFPPQKNFGAMEKSGWRKFLEDPGIAVRRMSAHP